MINKTLLLLLIFPVMTWFNSLYAHSPPEDARVFFENIRDGDVVSSPFLVKFAIEGFGIIPAGTTGKERHTGGHYHLLINVRQLPELDKEIPRDQNHLHFDMGETEAVLNLPPGQHSLQLLLGDEQHEPQEPALYSNKIIITVE